MQPSPQIHAELSKAEKLFEEMKKTKNPEEFEDQWKNFLGHLERTWNKCQHHFGKSPKWNGWKGRIETLRKQDPLLSYLVNARGANEHTVADITTQTLSGIGIGAGPSGSVHIKSLTVGPNGIKGDWIGDLQVTFIPSEVKPVAVVNRGKHYPVPTTHCSKNLKDSSTLTLAEIGLHFYQNAVTQAEQFFCTPRK